MAGTGVDSTRTAHDRWRVAIAAAVSLMAAALFLVAQATPTVAETARAGPLAPSNLVSTPTPTSCPSAWNVVSSPNVGSGHNGLTAVATLWSYDIWAVGYYRDAANHDRMLTMRWDGNQWSVVPSPSVGLSDRLNAVVAIASNDVWAVGTSFFSSQPQQTLTIHWNGTQWSVVPSPVIGSNGSDFRSVAALASNNVWAVGSVTDAEQRTLIAHWDGGQWSVVTSANNGSRLNVLNGVVALSWYNIWAVGTYDAAPGGPSNLQTLIERWDGTQWSVVPSPNVGTGDNYLRGVSAQSDYDVSAVGYYCNISPCTGAHTLALHWDGTAWSVVSSPDPGTDAQLRAAARGIGARTWAVGYYNDGAGHRTLTERSFIGQPWELVSSPNAGSGGNDLWAITWGDVGEMWAVGEYQDNGISRTLVERYSPTCPEVSTPTGTPPTATPSGTSTSTPTPTVYVSPTNTRTPTITNTPTDTMTGTPPTSTATRTPTTTPTYGVPPTSGPPSFTVTPGEPDPTPTSIYSCYVNVTQAVANCTPPDTYSYTFQLYRSCPQLTIRYTVELQVAPDVDGPWTTVAQHSAQNSYENTIQGTFTASVQEPYDWYRVDLSGSIEATGRPFGARTDTTRICTRAPLCPASWTERAPYPTSVVFHAVAPLGNYLYGVGGSDYGTVTNQAFKYNQAANVWSSIALMTRPRAGASAVGANGHLYVINGGNNSSEIYDPGANAWTVGPSGLMTTTFQAAAFLNGNLYRIGGYADSGPTNTVEIYGQRYVAPLPQATFSLSAVVMNGYIYVAGGNGAAGWTNKTYRYDPSTDTWSDEAVADMPTARENFASGVVNGRWVLAGGTWYDARSTIAWDPVTNTWSSLTPMLYGRIDLAGAVLGDTLYAVAGSDNMTGPRPEVQAYSEVGCASPTPVPPTETPQPSATATLPAPSPTTEWIATPTITPTATATYTTTPIPPPTGCSVQFSDVAASDTFYPYIRCLACRGVVSGYGDGSFHPNSSVTRGQIAKIVASAAGFSDDVSGRRTYTDVPQSNSFWLWIERLTLHNVMSGYNCGGVGEPCDSQQRPYFRWGNDATRGQIAKIVANALDLGGTPNTQTFEDVPPAQTFYAWIERLAKMGDMGGYECSGQEEPCMPPLNRPYFRPSNNATRGQMAKVVSNAFFPNCSTP